ncbi:MAG: enoyl-CoA hydratase/isomerase family protein [Alphaproteobacteria bacterium]|nr:MAG: enoyl-CoA hydratase/isomerase family protein [Alphaproteobacteria bacterium]
MIDFRDSQSPVFIEGGKPIGRLVLNRPEKRNAMSEAMWTVLPAAIEALDTDPDVRVTIVTSSSDKAFSAGADIAELEQIAADPNRQESNRLAIRAAQRTLARTKKATIAQIYGACVGGGCGLALHCDLRYAANTARFGITPARLGLIYPLNDTRHLIDLVGPAHAKSILFTGRILDADEAQAIGMVDALFAPDELAAKTEAFANQIAASSQYSVQGIKATIRRILDGQLDDDAETAAMFRDAHVGEDAAEGVRAFLEKRSPKFRWNG